MLSSARCVTQYEKHRLGRTFVAVRPGEDRVLGYFTLVSGAIAFEHLPPDDAQKLPKHPVPTILLGRLAVDRTAQGQGVGETLLKSAVAKSLDLSETLGVYAVEAHAIDSAAAKFYAKSGFLPLLHDLLHLYLPLATAAQLPRHP